MESIYKNTFKQKIQNIIQKVYIKYNIGGVYNMCLKYHTESVNRRLYKR